MVLNPFISVLLSAFNAEKFLKESLESILNQTYTNFELIIINDGSSDRTQGIIDAYSDPRIKCILHTQNRGLIQSLNEGILCAKGAYIVRMDADDIALPFRLEKQINLMRSDPNIDLIGTKVCCISESGRAISYPNIITDCVELRWNILFRNCFNHPTVMLRKSSLKIRGLNYGVIPSCFSEILSNGLNGIGDEDYLLFGLICLTGKAVNLNEILLNYRIHNLSLTSNHIKKQNEQAKKISQGLRKFYLATNKKNFFLKKDLIDESEEIKVLGLKISAQSCNSIIKKRIINQSILRSLITKEKKAKLVARIFLTIKFIFNGLVFDRIGMKLILNFVLGNKLIIFCKEHSKYIRV